MQDVQPAVDAVQPKLPSAPIGELNEILRRFLQYKGEAEWTSIVLDGAARFAVRVALFSVSGQRLELRGVRGIDLDTDLVIALEEASAFQSALASGDVVVTLRTGREVSPALAADLDAGRAYLLPITNGVRVAAVLFAVDKGEADMRGVELICGMAALVLQRQANAAAALQITAASKEVSFPPARERKLSRIADLSDEERIIHLRAQRLARVKVAEMQLAQPEAARAGREQNNVYLFLKNEIDAARESYQTQFGKQRRMADYLHRELVAALADGKEETLGEEYPGELD